MILVRLGVLILEPHKDDIIHLMGKDFYMDLLAIISQHHGEWGERPRTVASVVVHLLDSLESSISTINEMLEGVEKGTQISYNGYKLC